MFCPLLPSLLHGRRRRTNAKMLKIHWFLWVASHMRLFSGSARSNQISEGTRSKKRLKISSNMRTQGTNIDVQKKALFEAKMAPKMDPGGLLKRVRKTVGNSSAQKGLLDVSGAVKKYEILILKSSAAIPAFPGGRRVRASSRDRSPRLPGEAHLSKKSS